MAIDKVLLYQKIKREIESFGGKVDFDTDFLLRLIHKIIFNNPIKNCRIKGKKENWFGLPKSKSLFFSAENKGLPIGNLTSQLFGNIYLNDFDHFAKCELGYKYYGRYVDDVVIVHRSKEYLKSIVPVIKNYLKERLLIELHFNKIYLQHFSKGVSFLGAVIKPFRIYITNRVKGNFYKKITYWNRFLSKKGGQLAKETAKKILASVNSYLGMMRHYNSYKLRSKILEKFFLPNLGSYFCATFDYNKIAFKEK